MNTTDTALNTDTVLNTNPVLNTEDILHGPLAASPLVCPLVRLAGGLNALVHDGHLQGVELSLEHLDNPCFLLNVAPNKPQFYVELFLGSAEEPLFWEEPLPDDLEAPADLDDPASSSDTSVSGLPSSELPLCVLMNWMGMDTEPTFWGTDISVPDISVPASSVAESSHSDISEPDYEEVDFEEVLGHILFMTELDEAE